MAYENVKDLMTAICDAVREREGSSELIPHQELPARIRGIGITYFYNFGDECIAVTGGYSIDGVYNYWSGVPLVAAEKLEDCLWLSPTNNQRRIIFSVSAINFSNYRNVYVKMRSGDAYTALFELTSSRALTYDNSYDPSVTLIYQDENYVIYKYNVTGVTDNRYLKFYNWNSADRKIYAVWAD